MPVPKDVARWGMWMLLGTDGDDDVMVEHHRKGYNSLDELRASFMRTSEAKQFFAAANPETSPVKGYMIPPFILRRPASADIPWRFEEPNLDHPVSQLCTAEQMQGPRYADLCRQIGFDPTVPHRKVWEFAYILAVLQSKDMLSPGKRGLGFGTGEEPLPSTFARAGVEVTATDAPADLEFTDAWTQTGQWSKGLEELWHPELVDRETFFDLVQFRRADMNAISEDLRGYDFCWSACCFEHLGSIRHGLDFLKASLDTLKPGGVSVQTSEFNLGSNTETVESSGLVIFRKQDFETIIKELIDEGHTVEPLNLWPGALPVDEHIDLPPFGIPHLKLVIEGMLTTSIGIVITKKQ